MIRWPDIPLPENTQQELAELQRSIDTIESYEQRVSTAQSRYAQKNTETNLTFQVVRETLKRMCYGNRRCGYCEDSRGTQLEHIKPKSLYPEAVFVWENFLFICGDCNLGKNNKFAVFTAEDGVLIEVARKRTSPVVPPIAGEPVFINPRSEDPLEFIELDLQDTFYFRPRAGIPSKSFVRADYTIKILDLNDSDDVLREGRKHAYEDYCDRVRDYARMHQAGASEEALERVKRALRRMPFRTVWEEMKRNHKAIPELKELFAQAPEALDW